MFTAASRFQNSQDTEKYVSVVVLDEVGLAEDSPNLPLKALHPLLEDGTEGEGYSQQVLSRFTSWTSAICLADLINICGYFALLQAMSLPWIHCKYEMFVIA